MKEQDKMDADTPKYIRQNFRTLEQLSEATGVSGDDILGLIAAECLPQHSYEISETTEIQSFFGDRVAQKVATRFYAPSHQQRICEVVELAKSQPLTDIAQAVKESFFKEYRQQLTAAESELPGLMAGTDAEALLQEEWQAWLDGIYGLCTTGGNAEDVAAKEVSIRRIRKITADATKPSLTAEERTNLQQAVARLDRAASLFAPDERANSSRQRWIHRIVEQYSLSPPSESSVAT